MNGVVRLLIHSKRSAPICVLLATCLLLTGCPNKKKISSGKSEPVVILVSIPPLAHLLDQLRWDEVEVEVLLKKAKSPAVANPKAVLPLHAARARLFFGLDLPFEEVLMDRLEDEADQLEVVDIKDGIPLLRQGGGALPDPHIWLDPTLAQDLARNMAAALISLDSGKKEAVEANLATLLEDLRLLDVELKAQLEPIKGASIYVLHGAFEYFCRRYGLKQISMNVWGKAPKPKALASFVNRAAKAGADALFAQRFNYSDALSKAVKEPNLPVVTLDALPRDYLSGLRNIATTLQENMPGFLPNSKSTPLLPQPTP